MQLYLHDVSEFTNQEPDACGVYHYSYLDNYFEEPEREAFFIRIRGKIGGFAMVRDVTGYGNRTVHTVAEFYIIKCYRRLGIGEEIARTLFDRQPGTWQVPVLDENAPAVRFWKQTTWRYAGGNVRLLRSASWDGPIFEFESPSFVPKAEEQSETQAK